MAVGPVLLARCGLSDGARTAAPVGAVPSATVPAPATPGGTATPATPESSATPTIPGSETRSPSSVAPTVPAILRPGDIGPAVLALQRELAAAGYWLGDPDGTYGLLTQQAVFALQKAAGLQRDGLAGVATRRALAAGTRPAGRSHSGGVIEIDTGRQLVLVVRDGRIEQIFNTSTGSNQWYTVGGVRHLADTPKGTWKILWQVNGIDHGPLGDLYRPKYFNPDGIALHGYPQVPPYPASHGCVRLTDVAMDWMWSSGVAEPGTTVLVY